MTLFSRFLAEFEVWIVSCLISNRLSNLANEFGWGIMWQTTWRTDLIWAVEAEMENDLEPYDACLFISCGIYLSMPLVYYSRYNRRIWVRVCTKWMLQDS